MSKDENRQYHFDDPDPYLAFNGPIYDATPKGYIPFIDTARRESEWRALGFAPKQDRHGNYKPIIKKGLYFGFHKMVCLDDVDLEAIATGKKFTRNPDSVLYQLRQGCSYDDFCHCRKM